MFPTTPSTSARERIAETEQDCEDVCIFRCFAENDEPPLAAFGGGSGVFEDPKVTPDTLFSRSVQLFLEKQLKAPNGQYLLLLTKNRRPILTVTATASYGIFFAVELKSKPEEALAFLSTMPNIRYIAAPEFSTVSLPREYDPSVFLRLGATFRRIYSLVASTYTAPTPYGDPIPLFRLLQMKLRCAAELFGVKSNFLFQHTFGSPMRKGLPFDHDLFTASTLSLLASAKKYGTESEVHAVFMEVDRCPAICLHFRVDSELYKASKLLSHLKTIYAKSGCYFDSCMGEHARKEAAKIPGVGHMILNDRYAALGDHTLNVFAPIKRSWTDFTLRSPIFRLPDKFFEGFEL